MTDSTQQHAARGKRAISAFWKWLTSPMDNPWLALGLGICKMELFPGFRVDVP